jgi:hypothetical protein
MPIRQKSASAWQAEQPDESQSAEVRPGTEREFFRRALSSPWPGGFGLSKPALDAPAKVSNTARFLDCLAEQDWI